jgi:membrane peptidoglycan carboxypeptidase
VPATSKTAKKSPPPKKSSPHEKSHWLRNTILVLLGLAVVAVGAFVLMVARTTVPTPNDLATSEATIVYWADGSTEIGRLGDATRRSVPLEQIPDEVQKAILAAEDRDFYEHGGVSPLGIGRAIVNNVTGGSTQGGSTITQQYAKNAFLTQERSWDRKIKEALLAFKLETVVSKDEILGNYLNTIYFGRGAYGIEAASIAYFGVPVSELDAAQGAVLAAIIKSPSGLAPENDPAALEARWNYVLDGMVDRGWLTAKERRKLDFPKIKKQKAKDRLGGQTGFLLTMVEQQLMSLGFDDEEIQRGGLRITSTFDKTMQRAAATAVKEQGPKSGTQGLRIGLASVRPGTGEVVAIYGGKDFIDDQINNATRSFAQAGSTFKPFALAAATEQDVPLDSTWNGDSPATVDGYTFNNYDGKSYGTVSLLTATEDSINSAYVEMESSIGVASVADAALRAGIPQDTPGLNLDQLDLTFVLGTSSPSGLDMADAYATFAARGTRAAPTVVTKVVGPNGGLLYEFTPQTASAFDRDTADTVTYGLSQVVQNGTGFAAQALGRPAAGKTGTTDDNKSAWFVGYTPQLATAVLMAKEDADGLPISMAGTGGLSSVTGGSFPAAIWTSYMKAALSGRPVKQFPPPPAGTIPPKPTISCPSTWDGVAEIPSGCPTPDVQNEFSPEPSATDTLPSAAPPSFASPDVTVSQSPDGTLFSPSAEPTVAPVPTDSAGQPLEEGRPQ